MTTETLIASKQIERRKLGLHVRVTGYKDRAFPFDYYAKDTAARDRFIARQINNGLTVEIVKA